MQHSINSICIVGGGSAGWMTATLLSSILKNVNTKITVVESPDIATIGVGESTVPSILDFIQASQIDLKALVQATSASFKLGIRFDDWHSKGQYYFHPFGRIGQDINGFDFYQVWLKTVTEGADSRWVDHATSAIMAEHDRFMLRPQQSPNWVHRSFAHALHLDAVAMAQYLRTLSMQRGVKRIESTVEAVKVDDREFIQSLQLDNADPIEADFFIDCTGFKGVLIEQALQVGYESWAEYLPCDKAIAVQTENTKVPHPYTVATARDAGWTWQIPLQHRTGNGYVFSSQYCSDDEAIATLLGNVTGNVLNEPRVIPFTTGKRKKIWHNNCLALGLAAGFVEPLESTAIHSIYKTLTHFIKHFPDAGFSPADERAFNQKVDADYQEIRDFIVLHYCTSKRTDTEFWRWCQQMPLPDTLKQKLEQFKHRGQIDHPSGQLFTHDSWCSILEGMNIRPQSNHPLISGFNTEQLTTMMANNANHIQKTVREMPIHNDFIRTNCPADLKRK